MTDDWQAQRFWAKAGPVPWQRLPKWKRLTRNTLDFWVLKGETFLDQWVV